VFFGSGFFAEETVFFAFEAGLFVLDAGLFSVRGL